MLCLDKDWCFFCSTNIDMYIHFKSIIMKKIFTLLLLMILSSTVFGQTFNEKEIYGMWGVEKIIEMPTNAEYTPLLDGFENSYFFFDHNGNFELTTTSNSESFRMITEMTKGSKWKTVQNKPFLKIGSQEDGYSIMDITIKEINGGKTFHLEESGITLKMIKIE